MGEVVLTSRSDRKSVGRRGGEGGGGGNLTVPDIPTLTPQALTSRSYAQ